MWDELTLLIHFVTYSTATSGPEKPHSKFIDASFGTVKGKESWLLHLFIFRQNSNYNVFALILKMAFIRQILIIPPSLYRQQKNKGQFCNRIPLSLMKIPKRSQIFCAKKSWGFSPLKMELVQLQKSSL